MGIKSLHKFLRSKYSEIYSTLEMSELEGKKIAIDVSIYLYHFKRRYGSKWYDIFIKFLTCFRKYNIQCILVYDNKPPLEKEFKYKQNKEIEEKNLQRAREIENDLNEYLTSNTVSSLLEKISSKKASTMKSLLLETCQEHKIDVEFVRKEIERLCIKPMRILPIEYEHSKKIATYLGIPIVQADYEAESYCSQLCINGIVDAVLSNDTDVLAYGTPMFLFDFNVHTEKMSYIDFNQLLKSIDLNKQEFLDFCILCGTDYNSNIKGMGPVKSFNLISNYKRIEHIPNHDLSILNYIRVRELFNPKENVPKEHFSFTDIKLTELNEYRFINNI